MSPHHSEDPRGLALGLAAYGLWGVMPIFFYILIERVTPFELVACRIAWSFVFLCILFTVTGGWDRAIAAVRNRRVMQVLCASAVMIGINWMAYIYAVDTRQILQASLGYFVTPLVNVALGMFFFRERLRLFQVVGIALAAVGVALMTTLGSGVPYLALTLAFSFGFYGLLRKLAPVDGATGLLVETAIMGPPAFVLFLYLRSQSAVPITVGTHVLLVMCGVLTALPLLFFGAAARRLTLSTLGILQYLAPSIQFVIAISLFGETLTIVKLASFIFIWIAVALYTYGALHGRRRADEPPEIEPVPEEVIETA